MVLLAGGCVSSLMVVLVVVYGVFFVVIHRIVTGSDP